MFQLTSLIALALTILSSWPGASAHTVITYPGWRGDNLIDLVYPDNITYGAQWMYPCGGMPPSHNRTKWPVTGGAIGVQPGWFTGHATAFFYVNLGYNSTPNGILTNMSLPMVPVFQITGPTKDPYPGSFCLPQVPLPANLTVKVGDNATIQIVETAVHGAALYNCVDITFAEPEDVAEVNSTNCYNSTDIGFNQVYTISATSGALSTSQRMTTLLTVVPMIVAVAATML